MKTELYKLSDIFIKFIGLLIVIFFAILPIHHWYFIITQIAFISIVGSYMYGRGLNNGQKIKTVANKTSSDYLLYFKNKLKINYLCFAVFLLLTAFIVYGIVMSTTLNIKSGSFYFLFGFILFMLLVLVFGFYRNMKIYKQSFKEIKFILDSSSHNLTSWAKRVKEKDGYRCQYCGKETNLEAHHIIPKSEINKTKYYIPNGLTLCEDCHKMFHFVHSWTNKNYTIKPKLSTKIK